MQRSNSRHPSLELRDLLFRLDSWVVSATSRKVRYAARKERASRHRPPLSPGTRIAPLRLTTAAKCGNEPPKEGYDVLDEFLLILGRAPLFRHLASARYLLMLDQRGPIGMR